MGERPVAEQFVRRTAHQAPIGLQFPQLVRMIEQGQHAAGDLMQGGLVPGCQQQEDHRHQFLFA